VRSAYCTPLAQRQITCVWRVCVCVCAMCVRCVRALCCSGVHVLELSAGAVGVSLVVLPVAVVSAPLVATAEASEHWLPSSVVAVAVPVAVTVAVALAASASVAASGDS
jgi:hypothetical protein